MCLKDGSIYVAYLRRQLGSWIFLVAAMREQERERASNGEIERENQRDQGGDIAMETRICVGGRKLANRSYIRGK